MPTITPCLWFESGLDEAVPFYLSVFEGSRVLDESRYGEGAPLPAGSLLMATIDVYKRQLPDRAGVLTPATGIGAVLAERLRGQGFTVTTERIG